MIPNPYPGTFIVFDGIDGCGKSEQLGKTARFLKKDFRRSLPKGNCLVVKETKEPSKDRFFGKRIYEDLARAGGLHEIDPFGFQAWFACDSKENLEDNIIRFLRCGCVMLSDRFRPSMVYGARNISEIPVLMLLNQSIIGASFIWPDAVLIFDVTVETAIKRLGQKGRILDGHESKKTLLERVRNNYLLFAKMYPNCHIIDAEEPPDRVFEKILPIVLATIKSKPGVIA